MKNLLIIDDEPQIRLMLKKALEREGYTTLTASNGKEGIDLINKEIIDLVITDLVMPEKEGIETIHYLKKNNPNLPIIAISGGGLNKPDSYLKMAKLLGANVIFEKPIKKNELIQAVKALLVT